jgi:hypothetical protein
VCALAAGKATSEIAKVNAKSKANTADFDLLNENLMYFYSPFFSVRCSAELGVFKIFSEFFQN